MKRDLTSKNGHLNIIAIYQFVCVQLCLFIVARRYLLPSMLLRTHTHTQPQVLLLAILLDHQQRTDWHFIYCAILLDFVPITVLIHLENKPQFDEKKHCVLYLTGSTLFISIVEMSLSMRMKRAIIALTTTGDIICRHRTHICICLSTDESWRVDNVVNKFNFPWAHTLCVRQSPFTHNMELIVILLINRITNHICTLDYLAGSPHEKSLDLIHRIGHDQSKSGVYIFQLFN